MSHNKLILTPQSRALLKSTILKVYQSHITCSVTITFLKIYNIKNMLCMFPSVLSNIIHEYYNDELVFNAVISCLTFIIMRLNTTNVCLYNQSHEINYEIYFYEYLYPNVHFSYNDGTPYIKYMTNILKCDDYIFMNLYLDKYMKMYYNTHINYFNKFYDYNTYNAYEFNNKIIVHNHRVLKHIIIMSRILMNVGVNLFKKLIITT